MTPIAELRKVTVDIKVSDLYPPALLQQWVQQSSFSSRPAVDSLSTVFYPKGEFAVEENIGIMRNFTLTDKGLQGELVFMEGRPAADIAYAAITEPGDQKVYISSGWDTDFDITGEDFENNTYTVSHFDLMFFLITKGK